MLSLLDVRCALRAAVAAWQPVPRDPSRRCYLQPGGPGELTQPSAVCFPLCIAAVTLPFRLSCSRTLARL